MAQLIATLEDLAALGPSAAAFPASISDDVKTAHLLRASSKALSYVGKRYGLPLIEWGSDLTGAVVSIAVFTLLGLRRGVNPANAADGAAERSHDEALLWLRDVSRGIAELVDVEDSTTATDEASPMVESETSNAWTYGTSSECCDDV
jgi:phage gp36-like protein